MFTLCCEAEQVAAYAEGVGVVQRMQARRAYRKAQYCVATIGGMDVAFRTRSRNCRHQRKSATIKRVPWISDRDLLGRAHRIAP